MKKKHKKSPVPAVCSVLGTAILIIIILLCIPFTLPKVTGGQLFSVISGSMEPEIPVGSLVYVKATDPKEIQENDVIAFYGGRDATAIVTHRVVENKIAMGQFVTKGDANQTEDMNPVDYEEFIGRVEWSVPQIGVLAQLLTGSQGKIAAASMVGFSLVLHVIAAMLEKKEDKD